jgi:hypothetical protein
VKPLDQAHGFGVTANITNPLDLDAAVSLATAKSRVFMIEAHEPGCDHRLMVVDGRLIAAVRREPPTVTGDGRSSVRELVAELNSRRRGSPREVAYLSPVEDDPALAATLAAEGASMEMVLAAGRRLALRSVANRSTGGIAIDVTAEVHPQLKALAEMLAGCVGLRSAGIDYITTDIGRSPAEAGGGFIEVNAMPGLTVLIAAGKSEEEIVSLVLGERPGRIPVTLITGSGVGLAEVEAAIREQCTRTPNAALASPHQARIGPVALPAPGLDATGIVDAVLRYPSVASLTVVWPFERCANWECRWTGWRGSLSLASRPLTIGSSCCSNCAANSSLPTRPRLPSKQRWARRLWGIDEAPQAEKSGVEAKLPRGEDAEADRPIQRGSTGRDRNRGDGALAWRGTCHEPERQYWWRSSKRPLFSGR